MNPLLQKLHTLSNKIWGKDLEELDKPEEAKRVHMLELYKYLERINAKEKR